MKKAKYGIDAPKVIFFFFLGGFLAALFALFAMLFSVLVGAWLFLTGLVFSH